MSARHLHRFQCLQRLLVARLHLGRGLGYASEQSELPPVKALPSRPGVRGQALGDLGAPGTRVLQLTHPWRDSFREGASWPDDLERVPRPLGSAMQQAAVARPRPHRLILFGVLILSGCVSTSGSGYAGGFALTQAECDQTDSTVTCCLKQNPGQYERCGATPPTEAARPNYLPPGRPESEASPIPELPTAEEKERWRTDICEPHYAKCIRAGGDLIPGRKSGETQCQACFDACMRHGYWPLRANHKPCPGA